MKDVVINTIKKYNMIEANDRVIVGVSGGPDSMCLLHMLCLLKDELKIKNIYVAHINHGIRGAESDADEKYVENFCCMNNLDFFSKTIDMNKIAKEKGISSESAGREARYDFFDYLKRKLDAQKIATAHNANDQAETVLMRIMRGTGLQGVEGINPIRDGVYIRPLINVLREDIENYCERYKLNPRIDKTNSQNIYTRNKIRLELIPYIKDNFNKDIVNTLCRFSNIVSKDNVYLEEVSKFKFEKYCTKKSQKVIIDKRAFLEHESISTRILRKAILYINKNLYNLEMKNIYDILELSLNTTGKVVNLPSNIKAENVYGDIHLYKENNYINKVNNTECELKIGFNKIEDLNINIKLYDIKDHDHNINSSKYVQYFDCDKISNEKIYLRNRKNGDKFTPLGMKGNKKLKDFFIDLKIPREERDKLKLVCFGREIAWIIGYRTSNNFKIDKNTKNVLEIIVERGEINGVDK
ncbi:tRNA lysidine(34) synthetase TilS [Clostridium sporogenes]|uniref:tRNA lysidine(34) synthetase TilS n=1 Tax=Clostridium sp. LCP25S3_F8 TaxID=3438751 RepID=UPI0013D036EB|nr:tRNA lysidine(34) synthetase TilS [Clostridium sporogenes]NFS25717.1 tRNA lysidine(34) synthetase TilS [Clostridium sporogenes]